MKIVYGETENLTSCSVLNGLCGGTILCSFLRAANIYKNNLIAAECKSSKLGSRKILYLSKLSYTGNKI